MAKGATIYKVDLNVADIDRGYYAEHALTLACHPSETEERMMVRLLAFALFAHDDLEFGGGVSTQGEPALWRKDLTGAVQLWVELGHPDERDLRRACGKSPEVVAICYAGRGSALWWSQNQADCGRLKNLTVLQLHADETRALGRMARRTMQIQCNIQDGAITIIDGDQMAHLDVEYLQGERRL
ncbi:MAG: YaeQ family protein [Leptospirales bacterium]|jgi:uncharacterized protein YaeQ